MALASDGKLTAAFPNLSTNPVPTDIYWQPEWYERELEAIFSRTWLHLASGHEIPNPGDFVVKEIPTFGHKLIIVRGQDRQVRSFYNVCSHRGSHVELRDKGNCKFFTCPFHGWNFDHQGKLVGVPGADDFYGLELDNKGLRQVHTGEWAHHIFVNLAEKPTESLEQFLGEFGRDMVDWAGWDNCTVSWEFKGEVKVNWKLLLDAFNEAYHVSTIHSRSIAPMFVTSENPNGELLGVTRKGPHRNISLHGNHIYEPKPGQALGYGYSSGQPVTHADASASNDGLPKGLNEGRCEHWGVDVPTVFPNLALVVTHQTWFSHQIWPKGPNRAEWHMRLYMPPAQTAAQRFGQEYASAELRDTVLEDANTFERVQDSLDNGMLSHFTFRDHEVACRMQYHTVKEWVENYEKNKAANAA